MSTQIQGFKGEELLLGAYSANSSVLVPNPCLQVPVIGLRGQRVPRIVDFMTGYLRTPPLRFSLKVSTLCHMKRIGVALILIISLFPLHVVPAGAAQEVNCGKAKLNKSGLITNTVCPNGSLNLGVKTRLATEFPNIMKLTKKNVSVLRLQNSICADFRRANVGDSNKRNILAVLLYQIMKLDLAGNDSYKPMAMILIDDALLRKFVAVRCIEGKFVEDSSPSSDSLRIAQELVDENTKLQDSCFFTRTTNGNNALYAREYCLAKYPNNLQWALSSNHIAEENCFDTRVFNGDSPISARNICLARYPIRN
jgi:hypothetical protein